MRLISYEERTEPIPSNFLFDADSAVGPVGEVLRQRFEVDRLHALTGSISRFERALLSRAKSRVTLLTQLMNGWDSYGAPSPNNIAAGNAIRVLEQLRDELVLARVLPSAEGGIGICFFHDDRYADIECSNQGEFVGVYYTGTEMPTVLDIEGSEDSIEAALNQIRNHLIA
jgi:hypothetical protein